ncbi:MAG: hypothetical protein NT129_06685 [Candidatus Aenigmarchaeota archaeon]|nr:hypothetical protein [Candidatus Aenigmarchaeota archaeon]
MVESWGTGRPDFSQDVAKALTRKKVVVSEGEAIKVFLLTYTDELSPYPFVKPPKIHTSGEYLVDAGTGLPMPYYVPAGYTFSTIYAEVLFNNPVKARLYMDGYLFWEGRIGPEWYYENEVYAVGTDLIDPTASSAHTFGLFMQPINLVGHENEENLYGLGTIVGILARIHTPELTTKTIRCKICGAITETSWETTSWVCPSGHYNLYIASPFGHK